MTTPRHVAIAALVRVEDGAYANLALPPLLARAGLDQRDRAFTTALVYGATRMRRACDWLLAPHVRRGVEHLDPAVRSALRMGAYQLAFLDTPAHAAVSATVTAAPARARGLVNAVLRRVARDLPPAWPDAPTRLSYPDWIVEQLERDLGEDAALAALEQMNRPPPVTERADQYVQDVASQEVAAYVGALSGERVADLCAAPGGKATGMASSGAFVVASDVHGGRIELVRNNAARLDEKGVALMVADGRRPPLREMVFDRVLVDAPCSGLGVLARRADARWRVQPEDIPALAEIQRELLDAAAALLRAGGRLVYSVCTLTRTETTEIDSWLADAHSELVAEPPPDATASAPWERCGRGAQLLPQAAGTDGMYVLGLRRVGS